MLNRGYTVKSALEIVSSRYLLSRVERNILYRCVHPKNINEEVRRKTRKELSGELLLIDFYNVTTTIGEAIEGYEVYRCTDGFIRDVASMHGRSRKDEACLLRSITTMLKIIKHAPPSEIILVVDKQISYSKVIAAKAVEKLRSLCKSYFILSPKSDVELVRLSKELGGIVSSSDIVVLIKSPTVTDLAGISILEEFPDRVVELWVHAL